MNKTYKNLLIAAGVLVGLALLCWIASFIFLAAMRMDVSNALPHTVFQYAIEYHQDPRVQNALFLAALGTIGLAFVLLAIVMNLRKETIHGNAKWASLANITKAGLLGGDGILLGKVQGKWISLAGELFAMVAAPTRSGKGVGIVIPNLLNWPGSAVVLDVKFENYEITSGFRKAHGQSVYLFNPAPRDYKTHRYNPLGYISTDPNHRIDDIQKVANFLITTPRGSDPMWSSEARDLFFGIVLFLLDSPELPVTFGEVLRQLKSEKETAVYFGEQIETKREQLAPACIASLSNFVNKPAKERSGVKSTLTSALNLWSNPLIDAATSENDFDLRELRAKPTTIYIGVTPDNLSRLAPIVNMFVQQLIDLNTQELPPKLDKTGKLLSGNPKYKYPVLLLLDEFTAIGRLEILEKAIAFIAGYGLRLVTIIQSPSQLRSVYGPDVAETFQKNHAANVLFRPEKMKEAEEIANELGFKTVAQTTTTTPRGFGSGSGTKSKSQVRRQLLLPQEVRDLDDSESIVITSGLPPIRAKKIRYYEDKVFMKRLLDKVTIPIIEVLGTTMRGEREDIDLSFIYDKVTIPPHADRKLSDEEIETAANLFFDELVAQQDSVAA